MTPSVKNSFCLANSTMSPGRMRSHLATCCLFSPGFAPHSGTLPDG